METNNSVSYSRLMNMIEAFEIYCNKDAFFEMSFLKENVLSKLNLDYTMSAFDLGVGKVFYDIIVCIEFNEKWYCFDSKTLIGTEDAYVVWTVSQKVLKFLHDNNLISD